VPIVSFLAAVLLPAIAAPDSARTFDVTPIADGVYAVIRREAFGIALKSNGVFIVRDSDVVVVDAELTRAAARDVIGALRRITPKPVRHVINTSFPGVETGAQRGTRELRSTGRSLTGAPITDEERASHASATAIADQYFGEGDGHEIVPLVGDDRRETFRVQLAGDSPLECFVFESYFAEPAVARAHALARGGG
jgi:hypothetical protein